MNRTTHRTSSYGGIETELRLVDHDNNQQMTLTFINANMSGEDMTALYRMQEIEICFLSYSTYSIADASDAHKALDVKYRVAPPAEAFGNAAMIPSPNSI